jgi:hypothetical protein
MISKYTKLLRLLLISAILGLASGCGYFSDDPVEGADTYLSESLSGGCQIDVDELVQILEKDVQGQITCLEENLVKFSKYVKSDDKTSVSAPELSTFVNRFFQGHASLIVDSIGLIFDINRLFLQDSDGSISNENIGPLFQLLRVANTRLVKMIKTVKDFQEASLDKSTAKLLIENDLSEFSKSVTNIIKSRGGSGVSSLDLNDFLAKVEAQFSSIEINSSMFSTILSLKKLLLGGERNVLTRDQLFVLLERLPSLGGIAFNILAKDSRLETDKIAYYLELKENIEVMEESLFSHKREEIIFKDGEVQSLVDSFFREEAQGYNELAMRFKTDILDAGPTSGYSYKEVRNVTSIAQVLLEGLIFLESIQDLPTESKSWNENNWAWKRDTFLKSFAALRVNLTKNFNENIYFPEKVKIFSFISYLSEKFESVNIEIKMLDLAVVGKLALVGGKKESFSKLELLNLLDKSKEVAPSAFDLLYSNDETHTTQEMAGVYFKAVKMIRPLVTNQRYLHLITLDEVMKIAANFTKNDDILDYTITAEKLKARLIGGYPASLSVDDINKLLIIAEDFLGRYYFLDLAYDSHEDQLKSGKKIRYLNYAHHKRFADFEQDQVKQYRRELNDIAKHFRLYRFEDGTQFYGKDIKRSKTGLLEIFSIRFLFNTVAKAYGHKEPEKEMFALSLDELNELLFAFEPILKDFGLWSKYPETFSRNVLLLADLFQGNSNGNMSMDGNEATEYGALALFAMQTADKMIESMSSKCEQIMAKEETGFALKCYRPIFFDTLLNKLDLAKKLPKLNKYISSIQKAERESFLISIEGFARDDQDPKRPETRRDLVLLIGALLNIESTFLRYDVDNSNILEPNELNKGFPVYEEAIMSLANLDESKRGFAKSIFLYMIKNMKIPGQVQVLNFHYNPLIRKKISSKRLNIGALLYNMVIGTAEEN